jgi:hypothetical protein
MPLLQVFRLHFCFSKILFMPQAADIALVKHLLVKSRVLKIYQKSAAGQTCLEYLVDQIAKACFVPYAACMDELLTRQVPITLTALATLWAHISRESAALRWSVDEEWPVVASHASLMARNVMPLDVEDVLMEAMVTNAAPFSALTRRSIGVTAAALNASALDTVSETSESSGSPVLRRNGVPRDVPRERSVSPTDVGPVSSQGEGRQGGPAPRGAHRLQIVQPQLETVHSMHEQERENTTMDHSEDGAGSKSGEEAADAKDGDVVPVTAGQKDAEAAADQESGGGCQDAVEAADHQEVGSKSHGAEEVVYDQEPESNAQDAVEAGADQDLGSNSQNAQPAPIQSAKGSELVSAPQDNSKENGTDILSNGNKLSGTREPAPAQMGTDLDALESLPVPWRQGSVTSQEGSGQSDVFIGGLPTDGLPKLPANFGRSLSAGSGSCDSALQQKRLNAAAASGGTHSLGKSEVCTVSGAGLAPETFVHTLKDVAQACAFADRLSYT